MTASAPPVGFCHEALLYSSAAEFVAATTSFLRAGVAADDAMMVAVDRSKIDLLRGELGGDADAISFVDMAEIGRNPATIIPAWRDFVDAHAGGARGLRGIGEPVWPARTADELSECHQHEALLNLAFDAAVPFHLLCPYDAAALGPSALETAWRTHPLIATALGHPRQRAVRRRRPVDDAVRLAAARPAAGRRHDDVRPRAGCGTAETSSLGTPRHFPPTAPPTSPSRSARSRPTASSTAAGRACCGSGTRAQRSCARSPTAAGSPTPSSVDGGRTAAHAGGRGLWLANRLCDLVQVRSGEQGTVVRLHVTPG